MKSDKINELATALINAQEMYKPIIRESTNPFFKSKYANLDTVIAATAPALRKNGLIVIQTTEGDNLITTLVHSSGQWIEGSYPLHPIKVDPQGMGSAVTYARRYAYCAIVQCVPSDEDDDGNSHQAKPVNKKSEVDKGTLYFDLMNKIEASQKLAQLETSSAEIKTNAHLLDTLQVSQLREAYKRRKEELKLQEVAS